MKGRNVAWALILLGVGLLLGMGMGRAIPLVRDRVVDNVGGRFAFGQDIGSRIGRSIEITVPRITDVLSMPELPEVPPVRIRPGERLIRPLASEEIIVRDGLSFTVWGLVRTLIGWVVNVSALFLIVLGVFLIVRRNRQPVEKSPPKVLTETD